MFHLIVNSPKIKVIRLRYDGISGLRGELLKIEQRLIKLVVSRIGEVAVFELALL